jgi:ubiquinone/menaquinone biosynthesis C-methylase UbiE
MSAKSELPAYSMNRQDFPRMYETSVVPKLFRPWAELLLDRAELQPTHSVLDVACGTGIVARLVRERQKRAGKVVGVDVSAPMLAVARDIEPGIDWRQGDAAALPVGRGEQFDRVLCQQGIQFFSDRAAAVRELKRVTAPGGLLLAAVWCSTQTMPVFESLQRIAERHVGSILDQRYAYGDAQALKRLLTDGGFRDVRVDEVSLVSRFPDGAEFVRMNAMALVGMSNAQLPDQERGRLLETIVVESMDAVRPYLEGATLVCEFRSNIAAAR